MFRHALDTKCVRRLACLALILFVSCTSNETPRPDASPSGPPSIQPEVVESHAEQFEEELPERAAGSQQEFAAATYITAHLQQAGYVVEFDAVPVANTVRSTNVVGLPPSTEDPEYLVAVAYDAAGTPGSIAAFLEIARALRVAVPDHSVEFVALGAESASGNRLGSRRMINLLLDRDLQPHVIHLEGLDADSGVVVSAGDNAPELGDDFAPPTGLKTPFSSAGLDYTAISGAGVTAAGRVFDFLQDRAS